MAFRLQFHISSSIGAPGRTEVWSIPRQQEESALRAGLLGKAAGVVGFVEVTRFAGRTRLPGKAELVEAAGKAEVWTAGPAGVPRKIGIIGAAGVRGFGESSSGLGEVALKLGE